MRLTIIKVSLRLVFMLIIILSGGGFCGGGGNPPNIKNIHQKVAFLEHTHTHTPPVEKTQSHHFN